jgi:hypothetical protein
MRKRDALVLGLVVVATLVVVFLVLRKKATFGEFRLGPNTMPRVLAIRGVQLHRSALIWEKRTFIKIKSNTELRGAIDTLTDRLPLSPTAKQAASQSCLQMLDAYSSGNWDLFRSVRIPSPNYTINGRALRVLSKSVTNSIRPDLLEDYRALWSKTFETNGLFDEASFLTDSVSVLDMPISQIRDVPVPIFTAKTNQNWISYSPVQVFDYSHAASTHSGSVRILRLFFFGKLGSEVRLYMITFLWNENTLMWLPFRLSIAAAKVPLVRVKAF